MYPPGGYARPAPQTLRTKKSRLPVILVGLIVIFILIAVTVTLLFVALREENGIKVTLQVVGAPSEEDLQQAIDIIKNRLEALGIDDARVERDGDRNIVCVIPGTQGTERVLSIVGSTGQVQFREVLEVISPGSEKYDTTEVTVPDVEDPKAYQALEDLEIVLEKEGFEGEILKVRLGPTRITGEIIAAADAAVDNRGGYRIAFKLTDEATPEFAALTQELVGKQLAIVLDYNLESFPTVQSPIDTGEGEITGDFSREEARDLALVLKLGALPVKFNPNPQIEYYGSSLPTDQTQNTTETTVPEPAVSTKQLVLETTRGQIVIDLFTEDTPQTVAHITSLVNRGYYNNLPWYRVEDFVVQTGGHYQSLIAESQGGEPDQAKLDEAFTEDSRVHTVVDEIGQSNVRGAVGMAKPIDPETQLPIADSATTDFYILKMDAISLDPYFTIFGRVVKGMEVVDHLETTDVLLTAQVKNK
jgi:cyclophilin family peptidyl-prolyl cis-trans isomerase